jgi:hypothetical protein
LARFTLAPGEERDLGALRLEQVATLVIEAATTSSGPSFEPRQISFRLQGQGALEGIWGWHALDEQGRASVEVAPGSYTFVATDRRAVASVTTVTLTPGEVVHTQLELQPALKLEFVVTGARQGGNDAVELEVRDARGALILRDQSSPLMPLLPPGVYDVRARQGRRLGAVSRVTMPRESGSPPLELELSVKAR